MISLSRSYVSKENLSRATQYTTGIDITRKIVIIVIVVKIFLYNVQFNRILITIPVNSKLQCAIFAIITIVSQWKRFGSINAIVVNTVNERT